MGNSMESNKMFPMGRNKNCVSKEQGLMYML